MCRSSLRAILTTIPCAIILCGAAVATAAVPQSMDYQGYLTELAGSPADGDYTITFSIYTVESGGSWVWRDSQLVEVDYGLFRVELGSVANPFPPDMFNVPLWLGVTVGTDDEMTPRRPLTSVGFSFRSEGADTAIYADNADTVDGKHAGDLQNTVTGSCAIGSSIRVVNADGTVACETDTVGIVTETDPTVPASVKDGVSWSELSAVPAGFADGIDNDTTNHGALFGLADDDHPQYFRLNQNEAVTGRPAFNGGTPGVSPPFTVDSTVAVTNLNADYLDGRQAITFADSDHGHVGETWSLDGSTANAAALILANTGFGSGVKVETADFGVRVESSDASAVSVQSAGGSGLYVSEAGIDGVFVGDADGTGLHVQSAGFDGVYANTTQTDREWGVYTPDKIYAGTTLTTGGPVMLVAQNGDSQHLDVGDVVTVNGAGAPFADGVFPTPLVRKAGPGDTVVGVVYRHFVTEVVEKYTFDGQAALSSYTRAHTLEGPIAPGQHLALVVAGAAEVKANAAGGAIAAGDPLSVGVDGRVRKAVPLDVNGVAFHAPGTTFCQAMEPLTTRDGSGRIWALLVP